MKLNRLKLDRQKLDSQQTPRTVLTLRNKTTLACLLAAALFLLAACGGDEEPTPTPEPAPAPPVAAPAAAPTEPPTEAEAVEAITPTEAAPAQEVAPVTVTIGLTATQPVTPAVTVAVTTAATTATTSAVTEAVTPGQGAVGCAVQANADFGGYADPEQRLGCALAEASFEPVGVHEFGEGPDYSRFMLWFGEENQIYVLFPDNTWLAYSDTWEEGEPEIFCNPTDGPATSPPLPRRGFGKLWCTVESVQQQMGTSDREERLCQHAVAQRFEQGRLLACFEDATIRYFRLLNDGTWDLESVQ
jgi:hypothetical protein